MTRTGLKPLERLYFSVVESAGVSQHITLSGKGSIMANIALPGPMFTVSIVPL